MKSLNDYKVVQKLGQGTFGVVQKAKDIQNGNIVALKQLLNHSSKEGFPITAMREITIVKKLKHANILRIIDMIYEEPKVSNPLEMITQRGCFYTVSPYMQSDLVGLLENPSIELTMSEIKCLMMQLLSGIEFIHNQKYLHRDVKAANLLIDTEGVLKIADFGLARIYHGTPPVIGEGPGGGQRLYTGLVVTRWYRPPEILLGERKYTTAVDMWGVGCVFGELFNKKPILTGKTDSHQCQLVFQMVGPPNTLNWPEAINLPNKTELNVGMTCKRSLEARMGPLMNDAKGLDLLSGLLTLDPYKRLNATDGLNHEFFKSEPLPLEPNQLPKFEESHEIDKERFKKLRESSYRASRTPPVGPLYQRERSVSANTTHPARVGRDSNVDRYVTPEKQEKQEKQEPNSSYKPLNRSNTPTSLRNTSDVPNTNVPNTNAPTTNVPNTNLSTPKRPATDSSSIFMPKKKQVRPDMYNETNRRKQLPKPVQSNDTSTSDNVSKTPVFKTPTPGPPPVMTDSEKKRKADELESDLTDFEEDVSERNLESVLDIKKATVSNEKGENEEK